MLELLISKLDPLTFVFCVSIFAALMAVISFIFYRSFPITINGLKEWGTSMVLASISFFLFFLRSVPEIPQVLTILGANIFAVTSSAVGFYAWSIFLNKKINIKALLVGSLTPIILASIVFIYSTSQFRLLYFMTLIITFSTATFYLMSAIQILKSLKRFKTLATHITLFFTVLISFIFYVRVINTVISEQETVLFAKSLIQIVFFIVINVSTMAVSIGFLLMAADTVKQHIIERSKRDGLTGVFNRKAFVQKVEDITDHNYSILMLDIDHFKKINDTYGHRIGDLAITHIAKTILSNTRSMDIVGRYGGEEFCVMIYGDKRAGVSFSERILNAIRNSPVRTEIGRFIPLTISIGCIWNGAHKITDANILLDKADTLLYRAKNEGRDRLVIE